LLPDYTTDLHNLYDHSTNLSNFNNTLGYILCSIIALWWSQLCFYVLCFMW